MPNSGHEATTGAGDTNREAMVISGEFERLCKPTVCMTLREGGIEQSAPSGKRTELDSDRHVLLNLRIRVRFSFLIPEDFPIVDLRLVFAQWKQQWVKGSPRGSPMVAQRFINGRHYVTIRRSDSVSSKLRGFDLPELELGVWNDMEYTIRLATRDHGSVRVRMNGREMVSFDDPTAFIEGSRRFYNKIRLYRDRWPEPMTIDFSGYSMIHLVD